MLDMKFKNKKEEELWTEELREAIEILEQQPVHFFRAEHILPVLKKMTPEQLEIFEHLTGIYRQTLH